MPYQKRKTKGDNIDLESGRDPYVTRRFKLLALIDSAENKEYSHVVAVLSDKLSSTKHSIYTDIGRLVKEGKIRKDVKNGITNIEITDKTKLELIERCFMPFPLKLQELFHSCLQKKEMQDESALKFFKEMIPHLKEYLLLFMKNYFPEPLIPKDLGGILEEELRKFYNNAWIKSQLF